MGWRKIGIPFEITLCLGIFLAINSWDSLQVYMINGVGTVKLQTYVVLIGLIFHIPLALFLGNKLGVIGVCIVNDLHQSYLFCHLYNTDQ